MHALHFLDRRESFRAVAHSTVHLLHSFFQLVLYQNVDVCPAKNKSQPRLKATNMQPQLPLR